MPDQCCTCRLTEACTACCLDTHPPTAAVATGAARLSAPAEVLDPEPSHQTKHGLTMLDQRKSWVFMVFIITFLGVLELFMLDVSQT